jgi:hypothetical protein
VVPDAIPGGDRFDHHYLDPGLIFPDVADEAAKPAEERHMLLWDEVARRNIDEQEKTLTYVARRTEYVNDAAVRYVPCLRSRSCMAQLWHRCMHACMRSYSSSWSAATIDACMRTCSTHSEGIACMHPCDAASICDPVGCTHALNHCRSSGDESGEPDRRRRGSVGGEVCDECGQQHHPAQYDGYRCQYVHIKLSV